jgi:hypothetical protein
MIARVERRWHGHRAVCCVGIAVVARAVPDKLVAYPMSKHRALAITLAIALGLALAAPAVSHASELVEDCHRVVSNETLTVHGTIVQSKTVGNFEDGSPPRKFMALVLDVPLCGNPTNERIVGVDSVSKKWLGRSVIVTGTIEPSSDRTFIAVKHIVDDDDSEHCTAEEQDYDASHRELLGMPPGECVKALPDYPTRAAGWLAAVEAKAKEPNKDRDRTKESCFDLRDDSHKVTVRGTIEQSTTTEEGEGGTPPGRKYMSIVLDQPGCAANDEKSIAVDPVSVKWLGHHVAITGTVEPTGDGAYIAVQRIKDSALAVPARAAEKATDDAFLLACVWTGDRHHKAQACGGFPTRTLCEREGRTAVANGELLKFECISAAGLRAIDALFEAIRRGIAEPTAAGPGGSDQPTFGQQTPVRIAASAPDPDMWHGLPPLPGTAPPGTTVLPRTPPPVMLPGGVYRGAPPPLPPPTTTMIPRQASGGRPGWAPATEGRGIGVPSAPTQRFSNWPRFMKNARPSLNVEDFRKR